MSYLPYRGAIPAITPEQFDISEADKIQVGQLRFKFEEDIRLSLIELILKHADIIMKEYARDD